MTKICIVGWESKGLRSPDSSINFECADGPNGLHPISLLQMPNGTAKTTTLNLIKAALTGEPVRDSWNRDQVNELGRPTEKHMPENFEGQFKLHLKCETSHSSEVDLTYILNFNWEEDSVQFKTKYSRTGDEDGHKPPAEIRRLTKKEIAPFFVFNVETVTKDLFKRGNTRANEAIDAVFQLDVFDKLAPAADVYFQSQLSSTTQATQKSYLRTLQKRILKLKEAAEAQENYYNSVVQKIEETKDTISNLKRDYENEIEAQQKNTRHLTEAKAKVDLIQKEVKTQRNQLLLGIRNPQQLSAKFGNQLIELKNALDKAKLPQTACQEFFIDISEANECICGRPHTKDTRVTLLKRKHLYLADDVSAETNAMKQIIGAEISNPSQPPQQLQTIQNKLKDEEYKLATAKNDYEELKVKFDDEDPKLKRISDELNQLDDILVHNTRERDKILDDKRETVDSRNFQVLKKVIAREEHKEAELGDQVRLKDSIDNLKKVLELTAKYSRANLSSGLIERSNKLIKDILPDNETYLGKIEDGALTIDMKSGASEGEKATLGYSFLMTLFGEGADNLPFIVDYPAGPLDNDARRNMARFLSNIGRQFIGFTLSSETAGFIKGFDDVSQIYFATHFNRNSKHWNDSFLTDENAIVSDDGVVVCGQDFYMNFQGDP